MGQIGGLASIGQAVDAQKTRKGEGKDNVSFATALQGAAMAQETGKTDTERIARIQELKAQVASGQYEPDLNKVASSLLRFLVEG